MTVTRAAVLHRSKSNLAFAVDDGTVRLRLRTERDDVDAVHVCYGDKFDWPESNDVAAMRRVHSDADHDYWAVEVEAPNRRLCYAFRLEDDDECLWLTEWGFEDAADGSLPTMGEERPLHYYEYPYVNTADVVDTPDWAKDAVFYQIFPERFANGDPSNDPDDVEEWGGKPTPDNHFGGDLQGIIDNLDHLVELGVDAIYMTPVFAAETNHKYDTTDYMQVDEQFGDAETLSRLVDAAHDRDIRVVLDAVFNHCGRQFEPFQDVVENGADSEYADWFHVHEFPVEFEPRPTFDAFAFVGDMPKLDTSNPEVREYLLDVGTYWLKQTGADGWRLDVANEVSHDFWREFRDAVKAVDPEAYLLGEAWNDASPWLEGDQWDASMNYPFTYAVLEFVCDESMDAREFADRVGQFQFRHPEQVTQVMFNLLGSHDTPRLLHRCDGDEHRLRLAVLLLMTAPGTPCVYYGDEVGMTGGDDPDCRRPMVWDEDEQDRELFAFYRDLIALRDDHRALRRGRVSFERDHPEADAVVYAMTTAEPTATDAETTDEPNTSAGSDDGDEVGSGDVAETVAVAVNRDDESVVVDLPDELPADATVAFRTVAEDDADVGEREDGTVELPARSGVVWV